MLTLDLSGRTAVVTGAGGQLGRTIARTLVACGANVAVHYQSSAAKAEEVAADCRKAGRKAIAVRADVTDEASVNAMRDEIRKALGAPDIVVTAAVAQYQPWAPVLEQPLADYESQWRTCVIQNVLMAKAFLPAMIEAKRGRYIGINTECTMQCHPGQSAYVSGKGGMNRLLRVLAKEVGPYGVTVNEIAPGWMISDRERNAGLQPCPDYERHTALKRRGDDQDVAAAVAFLASDHADFITGVYLPVCGGYVMPAI
jgi:3-oxoacyl-[acyl-carrier protein] reductase